MTYMYLLLYVKNCLVTVSLLYYHILFRGIIAQLHPEVLRDSVIPLAGLSYITGQKAFWVMLGFWGFEKAPACRRHTI